MANGIHSSQQEFWWLKRNIYNSKKFLEDKLIVATSKYVTPEEQ